MANPQKYKLPSLLKPGAHIRIIAPASSVQKWNLVPVTIKSFERLGFKISFGKNAKKNIGYLAGTDLERLSDIHEAFSNKSVDGIICLRGGYGTPRLLDKVDYSLISKNPKPFCGFSDITAFQLAMLAKAKVGSFSSPNFLSFLKDGELNEFSINSFLSSVMNKKSETNFLESLNLSSKEKKRIKVVNYKKVSGPLIGGNLCMLASLIGTEYLPDLKGSILFLEEVNEAPYRLDRLLNQLKLAKVFNRISALVLGQFSECKDADKIVASFTKELDIPIISNLSFGHIDNKLTIAQGKIVTI